MSDARVLSIQCGAAAAVPAGDSGEWWDHAWTTGFFKQPVSGRVWLGYEGLHGDQQSDRRYHGGVDKAVCVYASEHFFPWRDCPGLAAMGPGGFGENFTTQGLLEDGACIGDVFEIGEARLQVSQPRQPCWKLARRWRVKSLTAQVERNGRTGFYFRVLRHGWVEAGMGLRLVERPHPAFSIAHANRVMHPAPDDREAARELAECPALSGSWKDALWHRVQGGL